MLAGIGISTCLEPSGGNSSFEPLLNPKNTTTTWMDSCRISVDLSGRDHRHDTHDLVGPGPRDAGRDGGRRSTRASTPTASAWCGRLAESLPGNSPVGSRMAIMLGGAAFHAAQEAQAQAHRHCGARSRLPPSERTTSTATSSIATRRSAGALDRPRHHRAPQLPPLPPGIEPGLAVEPHHAGADRRQAADADGRVQMYPCFSFEFHVVLVAIDPEIGKPEIRRYVIGHDCGTVINPAIVRGMTLGRHCARHRRGAARGIRLRR